MKLKDLLILEKREYNHRDDYTGNKKGSYIEKGKTKWDYSGDAKPGNERIVTQIQLKAVRIFHAPLSRSEVKDYLKTSHAKKIFSKLKKAAKSKYGSDEDNEKYRGYLYGSFTTIIARNLTKKYSEGSEED